MTVQDASTVWQKSAWFVSAGLLQEPAMHAHKRWLIGHSRGTLDKTNVNILYIYFQRLLLPKEVLAPSE